MSRLVLASNNRGKLAEFQAVLDGCGLELVPQSSLGIPEAEETGSTFVENALLKARQATRMSGLPALADDSGLVIDALGGAPGLIAAHYAGVHGDAARNIARVLSELQGVPPERRSARFVSVLVLLRHETDPAPLICEAWWEGRILETPRGNGGFGYDPIFFDPALDQGAGEMAQDLKNRVSHRGKALAMLRTRLARATL